MEKFGDIKQIGEGTYGKVYKVTNNKSNETYAIKKVKIDLEKGMPFTTIREIKMLKKLKNKNVVDLVDVFIKDDDLYMIMEYLPFDLSGLLNKGYVFKDEQIKSLAHQLIEATSFIHSFGLIHRDIKASNILINKSGVLKLADFGLTREINFEMTNRVCTLWYRAPELLLGTVSYDMKIDSWSIGCVIIEMKTNKPPFKGTDEISQIKEIFNNLGAPIEKYPWSDLLKQEEFIKKERFEEIIKRMYKDVFDEEILILICEFLRLSPRYRMAPKNALKLDCLKQWKEKQVCIDTDETHDFYSRMKK